MNLYERFYMYLFGFGSLVNIKSAQNSFKNRELKKEGFNSSKNKRI